MHITATYNKERSGCELRFSEIPKEKVLAWLHLNGFLFSRSKNPFWYRKSTRKAYKRIECLLHDPDAWKAAINAAHSAQCDNKQVSSTNGKLSQVQRPSPPAAGLYSSKGGKFSSVQRVGLREITLMPKLFQGRETAYAEETVRKIVREGFDESQEPIVLFLHEGKQALISGHSRYEAARRLKRKSIPAKYFQGTLAEAMDYALLESNRSGTQESLLSDVRAFKRATKRGFNREYLRDIFKPAAKLLLVERLSYLNEKGDFLRYLADQSADQFPHLARNAGWVGEIRKQHPALSDGHEQELFKYLYQIRSKGKASQRVGLKKEQLFDLVDKRVSHVSWSPSDALNLENQAGRNVATDPAREELHSIEKEINQLEKERKTKDELIAQARKQHNTKLAEQFRSRQQEIGEIISRLFSRKEKLQADIKKADAETLDLFSSLGSSSIPGAMTLNQAKQLVTDSEGFKLSGNIGRLLGNINRYMYSIVVHGASGSCKTQLVLQIADACLQKGLEVNYWAIEMGGIRSENVRKAISRNLSPSNQNKLQVIGETRSIDELSQYGNFGDVHIIDSVNKVPGWRPSWIQDLRSAYPQTIWVFLHQQTNAGTARGGAGVVFDTDVEIECHKGDSGYEDAYALIKKNRENPDTFNMKYIINSKKLITHEDDN